MNPHVDDFLKDGCGRCAFYRTPQCKVLQWRSALTELRKIVLKCDLVEEYKWSQPCYTYQGKNVLIVSAFREYAMISFFKGVLLQDEQEILTSPGKSSQSARQIRFTNLEQIHHQEPLIISYIQEAIDLEKAGKKVNFKPSPEPIPEELEQILQNDPDLQSAFYQLTPGRQRGYIIYFSQPKQSQTRISRIEKCIPKILRGEGMHDAYRARKK